MHCRWWMVNEAVSHWEKKAKVLLCLAHCKAGFNFCLWHRPPVQSLGKAIKVYIKQGQTKATSYFLLFHGLYLILLFLAFQRGKKILKCSCWKKMGFFLPWLPVRLWIAVKQMSRLKKFCCNLDLKMMQYTFFILHLFNPLFQGVFLWILYSKLELFLKFHSSICCCTIFWFSTCMFLLLNYFFLNHLTVDEASKQRTNIFHNSNTLYIAN